ncbi:WD40 repeat-like protein [Xylona heveae TC161]|uniref:WD40 repeat-like protein n=1 Tax=Xylona heveae (strain CBS 132557 / TC161) TaxID=1328760 RepID=A0A165JC39_XYLHT|nr:WD40 repeat-like protein [Xylona heveae TC161]KZF26036.1 WD40 repeat-like protein [Xylona heveae TC161]
MSMITATTWVPRGFAAPFPTKYDFNEEEFERISKLAKLQLDDAKDDLKEAQKPSKDEDEDEESENEMKDDVPAEGKSKSGNAASSDKIDVNDDVLKEFDLEHYDDDDSEDEDAGDPMSQFGNVRSLAYHDSNEEDPYITLKENEEENEEREDLQILGNDNLVLAAKVEDEIAHLEVYVYEDEADNLYVHHDIMLPAIPLCVEWLDMPVGKEGDGSDARGNTVAIGTFDPDIEVWDLDTVDQMYPNAILGQGAEEANPEAATAGSKKDKKKKKKGKKVANDNYHVDSVLALAGNRQHRNLLASGSADKTVKLWDLNTAKCAKSYSYHTDKVCSLAWHPRESTVLLSGSYDRTVVAADMRAPDAKAPRWGVESDVESVQWDPHDPNYFYISTEAGIIHYHDARNLPSSPAASKPVWTLQAHDESVSSFDVNPIIPGYLVTGSTDKTVKLWNVQSSGGGPSMVVSRELGVGKVFSTKFAPDTEVGFRLAVAGSKGVVQIWDTSTNAAVRRVFAERVPAATEGAEVKERTVGVTEDQESSDDDDDEDSDEDGEGNPDGWESMDED